jgi:hypothetical protein
VKEWRMRVVICLQILTIFLTGGRTTSLSYWMCVLGR